ncbi:MAG: succinate dehydrogenase cytochrome b558 subunit, partial [Planctomycetales bacterium]|nr:succinate dehydrogenase cytochrome b558 subunit [Planctomycetales bacterium]
RRLHSLSGLIPVGAYMCVHLAVNASVLNGAGTFQENVYNIHKLGRLLPLVEWTFIFLPILFHAIIGVAIIQGGLPNTTQYPYAANRRYTLQRVTGIIAFVFILIHVFHMHGWFNHSDSWMKNVVAPLGGGKFDPFSATSTAGTALSGMLAVAIYVVGVLACVFHLANGLWTMGITWGAWTSEHAQQRASWVCGVFGVLLAAVGLSALFGVRSAVATPQRKDAVEAIEAKIREHKIEAGLLDPSHASHHGADADEAPEDAHE